MSPKVKSVFELLPRSYCIFNSINRGVGRRNLTRIMRIWYWYYGHLTDRWRFVDECAVKKTLKAVERDLDFLFTVMPGIDEYSHLAHPRDESTIKQYLYLDHAVGLLVEKLKRLKKWDDTLLFIVSDHGLTATHTHFCVNTFLEKRGIKTFYFPLVFRKDCSAANMVSGNSMTHIYFKRDKDAGRLGWQGRARAEDIEAMHPGLLDELLNEPSVDLIAMEDRNGFIVARSKRGTARFKVQNGTVSYKAEGDGPFGYRNIDGDTVDSILQKTINSDYPDAPYQLAHIFQSKRAGDVIVSAAPGFDLRLKYEHPEHKGSHGSIHREHMLVPVICNAELPDRPMRTVDVFPTYLKLMGIEAPDGIDGRAQVL